MKYSVASSHDRIQFYVTFPTIPTPAVDVWRILFEYLKQHDCLPNQFNFAQPHTTDRLKLNADEIRALIQSEKHDEFLVDAGRLPKGVTFKLYHAKKLGEQSVFHSVVDNLAKAPDGWGPMLELLMDSFPSTLACQYRGLYRAWQGANCIEKCYEELYGPLPPGFRTWKQPPAHPSFPELTLIDISLNPGRGKELYPYSTFYATAEMWLGPHFWQYAKCTKEEVLASDFFLEKRNTPNFLYLKCWPEAFTRPDGEQGRMQQRLWKLFFHEDCEWPPGSGSISDVPVYGPSELMPDYDPTKNP